jgi:prepilin-type N-terminal cleavage/methylation domain-containing protein
MSRGFSLIEMLLACALLVVIGGAVAGLAGPLRSAIERSDSSAPLEPVGRAALALLAAELQEAGSEPAIADPQWRLAQVIARALPMRDLDADAFASPGGAVRITRTTRLGAQAVLAAPALAADSVLVLDTASRCRGGAPACGFLEDVVAIVYDAAHAEIVTIDSVAAGRVVLDRSITSTFAAGSVLSELTTTSYGTRGNADGSRQLVRLTSGGAEQPVLDNVVDFEITTNTADVSRVTQVSIRLRMEASSAVMRGPAGYLFRRAGTATRARQWVPDIELRLTIALRNPAGDL